MGNLSEHFNHQDFACRCGECQGEYKIHLGLVGALEMIWERFSRPVKIIEGYRCDIKNEKIGGSRKSRHALGKAANIKIEGAPLPEVFRFAETIPEVKGLGYYPREEFVHLDTRDKERELWVKEEGVAYPLTAEKRRKYNL